MALSKAEFDKKWGKYAEPEPTSKRKPLSQEEFDKKWGKYAEPDFSSEEKPYQFSLGTLGQALGLPRLNEDMIPTQLRKPVQKANQLFQQSGIPGAVTGFTQGLLNSGISAANLALSPPSLGKAPHEIMGISDPRLEHVNFSKSFDPTIANQLGHSIGNIAGQLPLPVKGANLLNAFSKGAQGSRSVASALAEGAIPGYVFGENEAHTGRSLNAALGGTLNSAYRGGKFLSENPWTDKALAESISKRGDTLREAATKNYSSFFSQASEKGVKQIPVPKEMPLKTFFRNSTKEFSDGVRKYIDNPTLENAHFAQSDLKKYIKHMTSASKNGSGQVTARHEAQVAEQKINEAIQSHLKKHKGLAERYQRLGVHYKTEVSPFLTKEFEKFRAEPREISPEALVQAIQNNYKLKNHLSPLYPGLHIGPKVKQYAPQILSGAGGAGAYGLLKDFFSSH